MGDVLIRGVPPELKQRIATLARDHNRSVSDEIKDLLQRGLAKAQNVDQEFGFGTRLSQLIPDEFKGELELPPRSFGREPPDFS